MKRRKFIQFSAKAMVSTAFLTSPFTSVLEDKLNSSVYVVFGRTDKKGDSKFAQHIFFPKYRMTPDRSIFCQLYEVQGTKKPDRDSVYTYVYRIEGHHYNKPDNLNTFKIINNTTSNVDLKRQFRYLNQLIRIEFHEGEDYINAYYKEGEQELSKSLIAIAYYNRYSDKYSELEEEFSFYAQFEDCFLTSACVFYKGLSDNCSELQILRNFRDGYMANSAYGKSLINDYYEVGPKTVQAIYNHPQKPEIFEFIYNKLVLKSVSLIKRNEYELAMEYYKIFTEKLRNN